MVKSRGPKPKELLSLTPDERGLVAERAATLLADELLRCTDVLSPTEWTFVDALVGGVKREDLSAQEREGFRLLIKRVAPPEKRRRGVARRHRPRESR